MAYQSKAEKKAKIEQLAAERAKRTPEQQLALLDERLGRGAGAVKERARLKWQIENRGKEVKVLVTDMKIPVITDDEKKEIKAEKERKKKERRESKIKKASK
jgi:hypothetical protein